MKIFYLIRKIQGEWHKKEIGIYDWELYLSMRKFVDDFSKVELIGFSKYGVYLLDKTCLGTVK